MKRTINFRYDIIGIRTREAAKHEARLGMRVGYTPRLNPGETRVAGLLRAASTLIFPACNLKDAWREFRRMARKDWSSQQVTAWQLVRRSDNAVLANRQPAVN